MARWSWHDPPLLGHQRKHTVAEDELPWGAAGDPFRQHTTVLEEHRLHAILRWQVHADDRAAVVIGCAQAIVDGELLAVRTLVADPVPCHA